MLEAIFPKYYTANTLTRANDKDSTQGRVDLKIIRWAHALPYNFHQSPNIVKKVLIYVVPFCRVPLGRGFADDYTSLAVLETFGEYEINKRYNLRHLERFKGISSCKLEKQVVELMNGWPFNQDIKIVLEVSSFGQVLVDTFARAKLDCVAVTVAEDDTAASNANLQYLFVAERLRMKRGLPLSNIITKELLTNRLKMVPKIMKIKGHRKNNIMMILFSL